MDEPTLITVEARVNAPVAKVWKCWTTPEDIMQWNAASDDWHTPSATNDLRVGGKFTARMEAKDGSMGFDFAGIYTEVRPHELSLTRWTINGMCGWNLRRRVMRQWCGRLLSRRRRIRSRCSAAGGRVS